jgi:catechol 2,3-dioxygenase-like lactoylglutathione lyase family enzyme
LSDDHGAAAGQRGLDHLVLGVRDLEAAAEFYARMGFQAGARNRHPWGTANRIVQFPGTFLELVSVADADAIPPHSDGRFSFGAFVLGFLSRREGMAMVVLDSADAEADAARFASTGIGAFSPFFFERQGRKPDGTEVQVAFTLAFARDPGAPNAGFFVCQHHFPENFWNERFQVHQNGATGVSAVVLCSPHPEQHDDFQQTFTGQPASALSGASRSYSLARGRIDVLTTDDAAAAYGSVAITGDEVLFVAYAVKVPDIESQAHRLAVAGVPYQRIGARLVVPASAAFGVAISFAAA